MKNTQNKGYDIFISYHRETGFYMAQVVYEKFVSLGYSVFMDKNLDSGEYEEKIRNAAENCRNFVQVLFPPDIEECKSSDSWLSKEALWATQSKKANIIPVMCDNFSWPKDGSILCPVMRSVAGNQGVIINKGVAFDNDMKILEGYLKNVNPDKAEIDDVGFFSYALDKRTDIAVQGVDMAFHAGAPWCMPGEKKDIMTASLEKGVPWRVIINTVRAAESIAKNMRDEDAGYVSFSDARKNWKKMMEKYPDVLDVRECAIPMIHVYHGVRFTDKNDMPYGEAHIKYYAYNNLRLDKAFAHRINSFSEYYSIYSNEFEFLWEQSTEI